MRSNEDKKFKPQPEPFRQNKICSVYKVKDEIGDKHFAKFFLENKLIELNVFESTQYNQTVLSDLSDQLFAQHFLQIKYTYSIPQGFIFVTDTYDMTLDSYLKSKVIQQKQAMEIFQQCIKAIYSLYMAGFWHRNIRPQHFVRSGGIWKLQSLVYSQNVPEANGIDSEYLWNQAYQPPQAYGKTDFSQQELDQMIIWNLGSLLVDILLSHHKLKEKAILDKYKGFPFSFKGIGVKKKFTQKTQNILARMLHYNPRERMKVFQLFSDETICRQVARFTEKGQQRKARIYIAGKSELSKNLSISSQRPQQVFVMNHLKQQKVKQRTEKIQEKMSEIITQTMKKKNDQKIETEKEILQKISYLTQDPHQTSYLQDPNRFKIMESLANNLKLSKATQMYKCNYDKCQLMMIALKKMQDMHLIKSKQQILLTRYAITFASMMQLNQLAQSMYNKQNVLRMQSNLWSQFTDSKQFKGFKQIITFRLEQKKDSLFPIKMELKTVPIQDQFLLKIPEIQDFLHKDYRTCSYSDIKVPYRKIIKNSYDFITNQYNRERTNELASLGMYITYCMTIDKLYIPEDMTDNFSHYFQWMNISPSTYVPLDEFQQYLDEADKRTLVSNSAYILKKYFSYSTFQIEDEQQQSSYYY